MIKRRWVLVEDIEEKVKAYLDAFVNWPGRGADSLHVLFFPAAKGDTVDRVSPGKSKLFTHETVCDINGLSAAVKRLVDESDPLIILLDVVLMVYGESYIQNENNIAAIWEPIDARLGNDLILMVTSRYVSSEIVNVAVPRKGCPSVVEVSLEGDHIKKTKKAMIAIEAASQEWTDRYDLPGKKLLHALMYAGSCGQNSGHINNFDRDIPLAFPLREAFTASIRKVKSFKALFYYAPKTRVGDYKCELGIITRLLQSCGIPCKTDSGDETKCVFLPLSPGAVFLVHLCRLVRLLDDRECNNPVTQVRLTSKGAALCAVLEFKEPITKLQKAYEESNNSATVTALNSMKMCCLPITPVGDATMTKTFERAKSIDPAPDETYVEFVKTRKPFPQDAKSKCVLKYEWEDKALSIVSVLPK